MHSGQGDLGEYVQDEVWEADEEGGVYVWVAGGRGCGGHEGFRGDQYEWVGGGVEFSGEGGDLEGVRGVGAEEEGGEGAVVGGESRKLRRVLIRAEYGDSVLFLSV